MTSMAIPPNIKARLEQLKAEAAIRAEMERRRVLAQQNAEKMAQPVQKAGGGVMSSDEREENLQRFLSHSRIRDRLYHATPKDFNQFKPGGNDPTLSGPAIWLSPHAEKQPAAHNIGGGDRGFKEGTNVMPVHVQARSPLLLDDKLSIEWAREVYADGSREFPDLLSPKTVQELKKDGYDSIIHADPYGNRGGEHEIIMFEPNKIKSAIGNRGTYDINDPDITKAKGGAVQPSIDEMRLALNQQGMYSPLEKAAMAVPRTKGTAAEFMAETSKQPGFRKDEVEDRKIGMPEGKLTKADFIKHLQSHPAPRIQEKVLKDDAPDYDDFLEQKAQELYGVDYWELKKIEKDRINKMFDEIPSTQYEQYKTPGGKNYREILLSLPSTGPDEYGSPHWKGEPNVLAHMRVQDRTGPNGEKILHVEEVQSDWHQEGRKKGYKSGIRPISPEEANEWRVLDSMSSAERSQQQNARLEHLDHLMAGSPYGVPDAPFKKNWHELALKHALGIAAKGGYHGIAITPGEAQADRYSLMKHVKSIDSQISEDGNSYHLNVQGHDGKTITNDTYPIDQLDDVVGKEMADKIIENAGGYFSGLDLKVGGEGMKGFYDKIVPDFLNKLGKKHGTKVAMNAMPVTAAKSPTADADDQLLSDLGVETPQVQQASLHYFPITNSLRQQIKTEGLPQYDLGGVVHKAEGGIVQPSIAQMKMAIASKQDPIHLRDIGINEAIDIDPKVYVAPDVSRSAMPAPGGVATPSGMPIGGIDMNKLTPGQQMMPMPASPQLPDPTQRGNLPGAQPNPLPSGFGAGSQQQAAPNPIGGSNILQMTPQGRAMSAMSREFPPMPGQTPSNMAKGGLAKSVDEMKSEMSAKKDAPQDKRVTIKAEGPGGVKGLVVPRHTLEGNAKSGAVGLHEMNEARAKVYGSEHREPLTLAKIGAAHKKTLAEHFAKTPEEQHAAEEAALSRLREAKHIGKTANTLDESEKLDTVRHEHDEEGRTHVGYASKGVAGHALYTSGHGKDTKYHVINTCPGQTEGCGGGKDAEGIVDTKKGTCFAPNAESQYPGAATRRAAHEQAKHDPKMTHDWILAHTGSLRNAARLADKNNQRLLFRPNVVDETDVSSRHVIRHLNEQRKTEGKPPIIANSYGKTNELHDPENGYYVTHSNVGPKVKKGQEISENIGRDKARVRNTVMAADNKGDFTNEQGHKTPPKGSYMVTDVKRGSKLSKDMEKAITHAKYWSAGRPEHELSAEEKAEGPEGHFSGAGRKTTEDKAHYGHRTIKGERFDYQRQHILHPRLVQVGNNDDGTPHMIPTDSRFKDTDYLPKNRYKTKNGKEAGHILMTTPTESTSNLGHQTSFTHHVNESHVKHAEKHNGEYEIDKPEDQIKARGKEYVAPQPIKFHAEGGSVGEGRHPGLGYDDFHAFPESNFAAQRHLAMRRGDDEERTQRKLRAKVDVHKDLDTMRLALTRK